MKTHVNIPIFIPHLGCPNMCVFCNQRKISGTEKADFSLIEKQIETALETVADGTVAQIAYFGGSFTGIDRADMIYLLGVAKKFIDAGRVESIRLSTRPDYISPEILDILKAYGVKTIELGLQSMNDDVLSASKRGHTSADAERACALINEYGFELVGQMMTGLPHSTLDDEIYTAKKICDMGASGARIYPTVVFCDTELCEMAKRGEYDMPSEDDLILRTVSALEVFAERNVKIIRIGLQSGEAVLDGEQTYSHTYHSALGEICYSRLYRSIIENAMPSGEKNVVIYVPRGELSKAIGQHAENKKYLISKYGLSSLKFKEDAGLSAYRIKITTGEELFNETQNS